MATTALYSFGAVAEVLSSEAETDLPTLIAQIDTLARGKTDRGISTEEQKLASRIQSFGPGAIPYLLPRLTDPDPATRNLVGYVARDLTGFSEEHLNSLAAAYQNGNGWIPPAIASIGTPRAMQVLIEGLLREKGVQNQLGTAFSRLGPKVASLIAGLCATKECISAELASAITAAISSTKSEDSEVAELLLHSATDTSLPIENRRCAIACLPQFRKYAAKLVPALQSLARNEPTALRTAVGQALSSMRVPESVHYLLQQLETAPDGRALHNIAAVGANARAAGTNVAEFLNHDDWELRWAAAETLGAIDFHEASDALIAALTNDEDWRLNFAAAVALGRLHEERAIPALTHIAASHWYPPVRSAARKALAVIARTTSYTTMFHSLSTYSVFGMIDSDLLDTSSTPSIRIDFTPPPRVDTTSGPGEIPQASMQSVAYHTPTYSYSAAGRETRIVKVTPRCGITVEDGLILGGSRGEWGGELVFVDSRRIVQILATENPIGIHRLPCGIVAVTGCGHMGNRDAFLYLVTHSKQNGWSARKWRALPSAPSSSGFLPDGRLYIACDNRLDVILSTDGKLTMADTESSR